MSPILGAHQRFAGFDEAINRNRIQLALKAKWFSVVNYDRGSVFIMRSYAPKADTFPHEALAFRLWMEHVKIAMQCNITVLANPNTPPAVVHKKCPLRAKWSTTKLHSGISMLWVYVAGNSDLPLTTSIICRWQYWSSQHSLSRVAGLLECLHFCSAKFIISWSKSLHFFIFHNFMVKINTFLLSGGRGRPVPTGRGTKLP
jgi:hypothetical protein